MRTAVICWVTLPRPRSTTKRLRATRWGSSPWPIPYWRRSGRRASSGCGQASPAWPCLLLRWSCDKDPPAGKSKLGGRPTSRGSRLAATGTEAAGLHRAPQGSRESRWRARMDVVAWQKHTRTSGVRDSHSDPRSHRAKLRFADDRAHGQVRQLCSLKRAKHFRLRFSGSCLRIPSRQVLAVACELRADTTASGILARIDNRPDSLYYRYELLLAWLGGSSGPSLDRSLSSDRPGGMPIGRVRLPTRVSLIQASRAKLGKEA